MTFNKEFLQDLQKRLANSDSYPMTKQSVKFLLNSKLLDTDKNVIFDAIRNDVYRNKDPLFLKEFWNDNIVDSKQKF